MALTVINLMGDDADRAIRRAVPEVEVRTLDPRAPVPKGLRGEVLFSSWWRGPLHERLDDVGIRWMHIPGTGVDGWPREMLTGRSVTCARGVSAIPIAEYVLAVVLAFEKRFPDTWLTSKPATWNVADLGELAGKTMGLVGFGGIGMAVARRALAFDMRVRVLRRHPGRDVHAGVELALDLPDLLASADHLVLAAPATAATRHLLNADTFALVKPGMHLVNVARGSLVDQEALRVALDRGQVAMASLDTVEPEPLPEGHWMFTHPRVRLSAHVSWSSPKAFLRIIESFVANLLRYRAGRPLEGLVDPDEGY